jgi:2-polyprenyl-3-methyl-5-hydroxy-6-metoxy-1,4-benzoquinol methylase
MPIVKSILKHVLSELGFEIRRTQISVTRAATNWIEKERSAAEFDEIWSAPGRPESYLNEDRKELYNRVLDFVVDNGLQHNVKSIADVGCGAGYLTRLLLNRFAFQNAVGFDFSNQALTIARRLCPEGNFHEHDIYAPLNDKFELLFCIEVLEHLLYPGKAFDNLLDSAAIVVMSIPNGRLDTFGGHINYWSLESWLVFLERYQSTHHYRAEYVCNQRNIVTWIKRRAEAPSIFGGNESCTNRLQQPRVSNNGEVLS